MRAVRVLEQVLNRLERLLLLLALAPLVGLSIYQIILRNLQQPTPGWIEPLLHQLVMWVGLLGAVLAVQVGGHLRLDLTSHLFSPRWRMRFERLTLLLSAGVCLGLARVSLSFVLAEKATRVTELAGVPAWIFPTVLPGAFVLMAMHFVLRALHPRDELDKPSLVDLVGGTE